MTIEIQGYVLKESRAIYVNSSSSTLYCNPENHEFLTLSLYIFQTKKIRPPVLDLFLSPGAQETKFYYFLPIGLIFAYFIFYANLCENIRAKNCKIK